MFKAVALISYLSLETKKSEMNKSFQSNVQKINAKSGLKIFFHPDFTVGFGVTPNHTLRFVGYTTGRELHPALKISINFLPL
jgi:hypothetical protein